MVPGVGARRAYLWRGLGPVRWRGPLGTGNTAMQRLASGRAAVGGAWPLPAAAAGRSVDAALRDVWRTKLTKAMGGDAGAAAKAEVDVHLRCRDLPSQYDRMAQQVELDAKRAAMHPAGAPGPSS